LNIVKTLRTTRLIAACALAVALLLPCAVRAIGIGGIESLSKLGEPLHLRVGLIMPPAAGINDTCLSLVIPGSGTRDRESYITAAKLSVIKTDDGRQHIDLATDKLFNDAFAKVRLQLSCPEGGSITKEFVLLPDPPEIPVQPQVIAPEAPAETGGTVQPSPSGTAVNTENNPPESQAGDNAQRATATTAMAPAAKPAPAKTKRTAKKRHHRTHASHAKPKTSQQPEAFQLKVSGGPPGGKNGQGKHELSAAEQKMLDADNQMARFLALQQQVKQLQDELAETQMKLAQLTASLPASAPAATQEKQAPPKVAVTANPPAEQNSSLFNMGAAGLGLVVILLLLLGLRHYNRVKSQQAAAYAGTPSATPPSPAARTASPSAPSPVANIKASAAVPPAPTPKAEAQPQSSNARNEADSVMEEAQLYAVHGHPKKAIEMMNELVTQQPRNISAWVLLFSILSSLSNTEEFSRTARKFLKHHKNSPEWPGIQALGRTLEPNNPLYIDENTPVSATSFMANFMANKPRSVGDILVEMGALSEQDLQNCLNDFDPKQHGRFGGYLISRKAITHAQLDEALRQQQRPVEMPTLGDIEKLLADFDPKRDGSIGDYLIARKALTPAQLAEFLQNREAPASPSAPSDTEKGKSLDFGDLGISSFPPPEEKPKDK
jgi:Tfp pilus assembly protein FimV